MFLKDHSPPSFLLQRLVTFLVSAGHSSRQQLRLPIAARSCRYSLGLERFTPARPECLLVHFVMLRAEDGDENESFVKS